MATEIVVRALRNGNRTRVRVRLLEPGELNQLGTSYSYEALEFFELRRSRGSAEPETFINSGAAAESFFARAEFRITPHNGPAGGFLIDTEGAEELRAYARSRRPLTPFPLLAPGRSSRPSGLATGKLARAGALLAATRAVLPADGSARATCEKAGSRRLARPMFRP